MISFISVSLIRCTEFLIMLMDMLLEHPEINTGMNIPEESENVTVRYYLYVLYLPKYISRNY